MAIHLCVTTLNRQDLLKQCLRSAFAGTLKPSAVFIVDQANQPELIAPALVGIDCFVALIDLDNKRGCEASAINWYLLDVPEERIIAHDDVIFGPRSLELFVATPGPFVIDASQGVLTYRDTAVKAVGLYDDAISPNHYRYCDVDYEDRLADVGILPVVADCGVIHEPNGTMRAYMPEQQIDYEHRQKLARMNYETKWGRSCTPGDSTIGRAKWRQEHGRD